MVQACLLVIVSSSPVVAIVAGMAVLGESDRSLIALIMATRFDGSGPGARDQAKVHAADFFGDHQGLLAALGGLGAILAASVVSLR